MEVPPTGALTTVLLATPEYAGIYSDGSIPSSVGQAQQQSYSTSLTPTRRPPVGQTTPTIPSAAPTSTPFSSGQPAQSAAVTVPFLQGSVPMKTFQDPRWASGAVGASPAATVDGHRMQPANGCARTPPVAGHSAPPQTQGVSMPQLHGVPALSLPGAPHVSSPNTVPPLGAKPGPDPAAFAGKVGAVGRHPSHDSTETLSDTFVTTPADPQATKERALELVSGVETMMHELTAFVEENLQLQDESERMKTVLATTKKENMERVVLIAGTATLDTYFRCWCAGIEVVNAEKRFTETAVWASQEKDKAESAWEGKLREQQAEWLAMLEEERKKVDEETQRVLDHEMEKACIEEETAQVAEELRMSELQVEDLRRKLERNQALLRTLELQAGEASVIGECPRQAGDDVVAESEQTPQRWTMLERDKVESAVWRATLWNHEEADQAAADLESRGSSSIPRWREREIWIGQSGALYQNIGDFPDVQVWVLYEGRSVAFLDVQRLSSDETDSLRPFAISVAWSTDKDARTYFAAEEESALVGFLRVLDGIKVAAGQKPCGGTSAGSLFGVSASQRELDPEAAEQVLKKELHRILAMVDSQYVAPLSFINQAPALNPGMRSGAPAPSSTQALQQLPGLGPGGQVKAPPGAG